MSAIPTASARRTSDPNAIAAFISVNGNNVGGAIRGINAGDFLGFHPYFNASRKQQMIKAGVNWQTSDKLSLGLIGRFTDDKYDSVYGVQNGNSWSLNLDATYSYSENGALSAYLTQQHMQRDLMSKQSATVTWTNKLKGDDTTVGLGVKHGGLMGSKLELAGDLTYSLGKTGYGTQLNPVNTTACLASHFPDMRRFAERQESS